MEDQPALERMHCACECPGCPPMPYCDGCDPPRLATWSGWAVYACDRCIDGDALEIYRTVMVPGIPPAQVLCGGAETTILGTCSLEPLPPEREAEVRSMVDGYNADWTRTRDPVALLLATERLLSTLDAARRERDAALAEVKSLRAELANVRDQRSKM